MFTPLLAGATTTVPWLQSNLTDGFIHPGQVNGVNQSLQVQGYASTSQFSTGYASSTLYFGANLAPCSSASNALTWSAGTFGCNTISGGSSFAWPFTKQSSGSQATSTVMEFIGGFMSDASSTLTTFTGTNGSTTSTFNSPTITGTNFFSTASSTFGTLYGASLTSCNAANSALTWNSGAFGCNTINSLTFAYPFKTLSTGEEATGTTMAFLNGFVSTASSTLTTFQATYGSTTEIQTTSNTLLATLGGRVGVATTTPEQTFTVASTTSILVQENKVATSTSQTIDWSTSNNYLVQIGTAGVTMSFTNFYVGQHEIVTVCNPGTTGGAITWPSNVTWAGGTPPTQTTTANVCDIWSFLATMGTSTTANPGSLSKVKIFGAATLNFQ